MAIIRSLIPTMMPQDATMNRISSLSREATAPEKDAFKSHHRRQKIVEAVEEAIDLVEKF